MREAFYTNNDPSPKSILVSDINDLKLQDLKYPIIVKPTDRSGSRGITKLENKEGLKAAIEYAKNQGFENKALVEEFAKGQEYSIECVSWKGRHFFLAMTKKYTTEAPHFIETGHLEPASVSPEILEKVKSVVFHALDSLEIANGASHAEVRISEKGEINIIEIGGRMGGDFIGSDLVELSTGIDFVKAVIQIAMGEKPDLTPKHAPKVAGVRFVFNEDDVKMIDKLQKEHPDYIVNKEIHSIDNGGVTDSSTRYGYCLMAASTLEQIEEYSPDRYFRFIK